MRIDFANGSIVTGDGDSFLEHAPLITAATGPRRPASDTRAQVYSVKEWDVSDFDFFVKAHSETSRENLGE